MADDFGWGRDRFVTEGRTMATLHHVPAIVKVFDFLEANGTAYIVMELLSGETLEDRLKRQGTLMPDEVDRILWPLLDGLEQVHAAGFLHRDIKPANILLNAQGDPTLIDFGAAREAMVGRTSAMTAIFTPGYAAAEQMTSAKQGPWTDIYGLAATLYHAIAGKTPPSAFDRMLDDGYEPLARLAPKGFPSGLLAGIDAGLAVAARDRPQSIAGWRPILGMTAAPAADATVMMGKAEAPVVARQSVLTPEVAPAAAAAPKSRMGLWIALGVVLIAALGGGGYYATAMRGPDPEVVKAKAAADAAEAAKRELAEANEKLRAENAEREAKAKSEQEAKARAKQKQEAQEAQEAIRRQAAQDERRRIDAELAEKKRLEDEEKKKADEEREAKRKAEEDARKAAEFLTGQFDYFGETLMFVVLRGNPKPIRLQGIDVVNETGLRQLAVNALASKPRNLRCRQTDRLTDGTPLYRCLITKLDAKEPLADVPDSDRSDLAQALIRGGLVLASCDAPRAYADDEDEARGKSLNLWSMMKPPEYRRRCAR